MNRVYLLLAFIIGLGLTSNAQSTNPSDSTQHHHYGMRRDGGRETHGAWASHGRGDSAGRKGWQGGHGGWAHGGQGNWAGRGHGGQGFGRQGFHGRGGFRGGRGEWAHNRMGHRGMGGMGIHYTPEQRKQVMAINQDYRKKSQDLYKQDNLTLKQYKAGLVALQKEKKDKLGALLTPQQKDQIAMRRKRMDENRQVMEAAHLERLKLRLNLTDDQIARIKAGQENLHGQVKAIHENDNLLPQQKREQMKALMAKRNDTYKSVLTPEQYSQFEKMHSRRHFGGMGTPGMRGGQPV